MRCYRNFIKAFDGFHENLENNALENIELKNKKKVNK